MAPPGNRQTATLTIFEPSGSQRAKIDFQLNPSDYRITKGANYNRTPNKSTDASNAEFTGATARTMSLRMLLLACDAQGHADPGRADKIGEDIEQLFKCCAPSDGSKNSGTPSAPQVQFQWGQVVGFKAVVTTVAADYQTFLPDGRPSKVEVSLDMEEVTEPTPGQNPTSGGLATMRTRMVVDGDTLASIAFGEYRDAALWRALASANGIDDPMRVRSGTSLLVPPRPEAAELR
ncbi:MAG: peptidase M23 [Acidimicrobiales bacterium]